MINWGIIGLGNIAKRFAASLSHSTGGRLSAVASRQAAKRLQYTEQYTGVKAYGSYGELIADDGIDAIYIALPHGMHMQYSIQAMQAGKAVLCEKPVTLTAADMRQVAECAAGSGVFFMEAMKTRFVPMMGEIKAAIEGGIIGSIEHIYANFCSRLDESMLEGGSFIADPSQGGALLDTGPYPISFVADLLGYDINGMECDLNRAGNGLILSARGVLRYESATAEVEASIIEKKERTAVITGSKGVMKVPVYNRPGEYSIEFNDGSHASKQLEIPVDDMFGEIEEVHRCLRQGLKESPRCPIQHSIAVMEIIDGLQQVAR